MKALPYLAILALIGYSGCQAANADSLVDKFYGTQFERNSAFQNQMNQILIHNPHPAYSPFPR